MQSAAEHVLAVLDRRHTPGPGGRGRARGPRRRVRARQPRPDLRHAGGDRRRLARLPRRRPGRPGRPRQRLRADRRGGHPAGPPGPPRRAADARRRRARRPLRGRPTRPCGRPASTGTRSPTGPVGGRPVPAQRAVLGRRQLVGRRPGRAQPRRRGALVERQAPRRLRRPAAAGQSPAQDAELLDDADRALETIMLGLRLREGLPVPALSATGRERAGEPVARGLLEPARARRRPRRPHPPRPPARRRRHPRPHRLIAAPSAAMMTA